MNNSTPQILHLAPVNIAGVPITLVKAERELGYFSRLVTLAKHPLSYEEDICLDLPFLTFNGIHFLKQIIRGKQTTAVSNIHQIPDKIPLKWQAGPLEIFLIRLREKLWTPKINSLLSTINIDSFDIIQLDGGLEFYRDGRIVRSLKKKGKKIICCYLGSDLRIRGVIPEIDAIADLNISDEFDHLQLHPNIHHVFFPFDWKKFKPAKIKQQNRLKIGHAPTNRAAKGSDIIIPIIRELENDYPVELILIEKLSYQLALTKKADCDIFVDQIGDLGYGINSLEALAMEIPACSCVAPGFTEKYPDHPFVEINKDNLRNKLIELISDEKKRLEIGRYGRKWISTHHDAVKIAQRIHRLAGL